MGKTLSFANCHEGLAAVGDRDSTINRAPAPPRTASWISNLLSPLLSTEYWRKIDLDSVVAGDKMRLAVGALRLSREPRRAQPKATRMDVMLDSIYPTPGIRRLSPAAECARLRGLTCDAWVCCFLPFPHNRFEVQREHVTPRRHGLSSGRTASRSSWKEAHPDLATKE